MEFLILGHFLGPDGFEMSKLFGKDILRWCNPYGHFRGFVTAWFLRRVQEKGKEVGNKRRDLGGFKEGDRERWRRCFC
jgi:hypothetical protein